MGLGLAIFFKGEEGEIFQKLMSGPPLVLSTEEYARQPKSPNPRTNKLVILN